MKALLAVLVLAAGAGTPAADPVRVRVPPGTKLAVVRPKLSTVVIRERPRCCTCVIGANQDRLR